MIMSILELMSKLIGEKRRWREYKARIARLPANYREAAEAFERYLMYFGSEDPDSVCSMFEDLADLFEQSAAAGTPMRKVVGEDPVEFIDAFLRNYPEGQWRHRERDRLTNAIASVTRDEP
jgi:DNA-binding ferritin-like protein (Dps family)